MMAHHCYPPYAILSCLLMGVAYMSSASHSPENFGVTLVLFFSLNLMSSLCKIILYCRIANLVPKNTYITQN